MASNDRVRAPRLTVLANGAPVPGILSADIHANAHAAADRFTVRAAISPVQAAHWSALTDALVDIRVTLDTAPPASLVVGAVDTVAIDPIDGTLRLDGRDLTAALVETRTHETFANRTSSEIATVIAERHGLIADIQRTATPVGRYWQLEHDRITLDQFAHATTEWDLLTSLASHEGFDVWITGGTLHFRPASVDASPSAALRSTATPSGPANVTSLRLERALTLARDIEVMVKSWNSRQQAAFVQTARSSRSGNTGTGGSGIPRSVPPLRYVFVVPNLTPDDALQLAQRKLAALSRHERVVVAEMPGELTLTPHAPVRVEGTGTSFDQTYWIDEIDRSFHWRDGFTQRVRARNADVGVTVGG